jgi:hypothetical protein
MDLSIAYKELKQRIDQVDFSQLWRGFQKTKFAVYNDTACFFDGAYIEKTEAFLANTSIQYNGEHIAIWYLPEAPSDWDQLSASIIHEMFHAYQNASGESRWPDEKAALLHYQYTSENLSAKLQEAELISTLLNHNPAADFEALLGARKSRAQKHSYEYDYEARIEQIEGTANYVELRALEQLDPAKAQAKWDTALKSILDPANYLPIRIVSYAIGALFLACIKKQSVFDFESFADEPFSIKILEDILPYTGTAQTSPIIDTILKEYQAETNAIIESTLAKNELVIEGKYPLIGLNVYNARWNGRYATSTYFIAYQDGAEMKTLYGDFIVEIDEDYNILTAYRQ